MRVKELFVLQEVAGESVVVPIGEEVDKLHGVIKLNESGSFLWKLMRQEDYSEESLTKKLAEAFSIEDQIAQADVKEFLSQLKTLGCLEE